MAITYGFYNSMNGDRKYDAVQLSSIFDGVIRDGVFQSIGGYLATKPGIGMQVIVAPGKAWFDHTWTVNDADLPLDISQSDVTLSRYDAVVLETDATKSVRENSIKVIKGTPASAPQKPTLTNEGDIHQHPLAYILVPGGSTEIQAQNIDIMVGKTECPFVTSILESVSIEALLEKWEGEFKAWSDEKENDFQTWFDDLQSQMAGDVATNLQNQINKINQTTATEETKSLYGVPSDGTPDDVFQAIHAIGDIKVSIRSDLGESWILCNGEGIPSSEYPKLCDLLGTEGGTWTHITETIPSEYSRSIYFCDGNVIVRPATDTDGFGYKPIGTDAWKKSAAIGANWYGTVYKLNGKYAWVAGNEYAFLLYVSESLAGPWSEADYTTPDGVTKCTLVKELNGKCIFVHQPNDYTSTNYRKVKVGNDVENGPWQEYFLTPFQNKNIKVTDMEYVNGKYFIVGWDSNHKTYTCYTEDFVTYSELKTQTYQFDRVLNHNGKLYGFNSSGLSYFYETEDPSAVFTRRSTGTATVKMGVVFDDFIVMAGNQSAVLDTASDTLYQMVGAYQFGDSTVDYGISSDNVLCIRNGRVSDEYYSVKLEDVLTSYVPEISISGAYAYIRGK